MQPLQSAEPCPISRDLESARWFAEAWGMCYARRDSLKMEPFGLRDKAKARWEYALATVAALRGGSQIEVYVDGKSQVLHHTLTITGSYAGLATELRHLADHIDQPRALRF